MEGTDGKKKDVDIRISNVKPTTFGTLTLSGTDEVENNITLKFKRGDVKITGL